MPWPEDELIPLSKEGGFAARHVLTSKSGVAVHNNATFLLECWATTNVAGRNSHHQTSYATAQRGSGDGEINCR